MEIEAPRLTQTERLRERRSRLVSAIGIAVVTVLVAATAHGFASGEWPEWSALLTALPFTVLLGLSLLGRRLAGWRIALVVALDQSLFHLIASAASVAAASAASAPGSATPAGHVHGLPTRVDLSSLTAFTATAVPDAGMILAHLSIAAVSFTLLRGGWQLVTRAIADGAAILVRQITVTVPVARVARRLRAIPRAPRQLTSALLEHTLSLRGPPARALLG